MIWGHPKPRQRAGRPLHSRNDDHSSIGFHMDESKPIIIIPGRRTGQVDATICLVTMKLYASACCPVSLQVYRLYRADAMGVVLHSLIHSCPVTKEYVQLGDIHLCRLL